jgi:cell division protein FtsX
MLRIWLLVSSAWVMGWTIHLTMDAIGGGLQTIADVLAVAVLLFLPPIALLIFCMAARWAIRGFQASIRLNMVRQNEIHTNLEPDT